MGVRCCVCLSVCLPVCLCVCLSACLPAGLPACLPVCLPVSCGVVSAGHGDRLGSARGRRAAPHELHPGPPQHPWTRCATPALISCTICDPPSCLHTVHFSCSPMHALAWLVQSVLLYSIGQTNTAVILCTAVSRVQSRLVGDTAQSQAVSAAVTQQSYSSRQAGTCKTACTQAAHISCVYLLCSAALLWGHRGAPGSGSIITAPWHCLCLD